MQGKQKEGRRWKTAAFTIAETLVVMVISGILLLAVYEGIGTVKRYSERLLSRLAGDNDLLGGAKNQHNSQKSITIVGA